METGMQIVKLLRRLGRCDAGVSAVEFAVLAPVLIGGLLFLVDVGIAIGTRMEMDRNVRAGAQAAMSLNNSTASIEAIMLASAERRRPSARRQHWPALARGTQLRAPRPAAPARRLLCSSMSLRPGIFPASWFPTSSDRTAVSKFVKFRSATRGSVLVAVWRDRRGATAIEFVVVVSALLMIVLATLQFGRVLAARNEMSYALSRAVRVVHLDATTTTEEIVDMLEEGLGTVGGELDVSITEIAGTNFMEISVEFPFELSLPFRTSSVIDLRVATLAPMVSPTQ